jgi:hypothetical protein
MHHPSCTHRRMPWFEQYFKTVEEPWKFIVSHQRGWDVKLPVFLPAYRASTHNTAGLTPSNPVFRRNSICPVTCYPVFPPARMYPQSASWQTLWIGYTTPTITPANIWSWPSTEWKLQATKMVMMYHPAALKESHLSFQPHGKAHTGSSPESTVWCTGFSDNIEWR